MEAKSDDIHEKLKKAHDATSSLSPVIDTFKKAVDKVKSATEKEYEKDVIIDGRPAHIILYKRGVVALKFRDIEDAKIAIEKLLK